MSDFDQNQAHLSGVHILRSRRRRTGRQRQEQQRPSSCWWNLDVNPIANILEGRGRCRFGAVALLDNNNNTSADHGGGEDSMLRVVVVGGEIECFTDTDTAKTDSVLILTITGSLSSLSSATAKHEWRQGPSLRQPRADLAVTVCGPFLYACGGTRNATTMERILLIDLFQNSDNHQMASWDTLSAQLSEPRAGPCAVTVPGDRFFLVMGGYNNYHRRILSSVDIVDTQMPCTTTTNTTTTTTAGGRSTAVVQAATVAVSVRPGPNMQVPRYAFAAAVLDTKVWVVGGTDNQGVYLNSMEHLQLPLQAMNHDNNGSDDSGSSSLPSSSLVASLHSSSWQLLNNLSLSTARKWHSLAAMPDHGCLVVAGGQAAYPLWQAYSSVEVVDVRRGVVWALPPMTVPRHSFSMLYLPNHNQLLALAGFGVDFSIRSTVEFLFYVDVSSWLRLKQQLIKMQLEEKHHEEPSIMRQQHRRTKKVQRLWNTLLFFNLLQRHGSAK